MAHYVKVFDSIIHSTIWRESHTTRIVWLTMLAMADENGEVQASLPGLADAARVTIEECQQALQVFLSPDPYSRSKTCDGRRIEEISGGWELINYKTFRALKSKEQEKELGALRSKRYRDRNETASPSRKITPEPSLSGHGGPSPEPSLPPVTVTKNHGIGEVEVEGKKRGLTHEDEIKTGTTIAEPAPARVDGEPVPPNIDETWGFLDDELGTSETEPAPLAKVLEEEMLEIATSMMEVQSKAEEIYLRPEVSPTEFTGLSSLTPCAHTNTIVTAQGEVDRDRTCTDCGLTWIEAREYTSAPVGHQPKPKKAKPEAKKVDPMPTAAEAPVFDPALQAEARLTEPFQPGPRASGMVVQELLDNCKTHSINPDSIWLYAVQKGYARPGADGSRNWMSLSEHGAGRFLNLMQPAKLRGLKEHLRTHFENGVTA